LNTTMPAILLTAVNYECPITEQEVTIPAHSIVHVDALNDIALYNGMHIDLLPNEYKIIYN
jgi:hypothetical protein